jgi:hypothetical protein
VADVYRLLHESRVLAPPPADGIDFFPYGIEAIRNPLKLMVQYSVEQAIIPRAYSVEELLRGGGVGWVSEDPTQSKADGLAVRGSSLMPDPTYKRLNCNRH